MLVILTVLIAAAAGDPLVSKYVGRWNSPTSKTPSSEVSDGPLLGNGDLGSSTSLSLTNGVEFWFGKTDFWAFDIVDYHLWSSFTHLSLGSLKFVPLNGEGVAVEASQDLYRATVNASVTTNSGAVLQTSSIIASNSNILMTQLECVGGDAPSMLVNITVATTNVYGLYTRVGVADGDGLPWVFKNNNVRTENSLILSPCNKEVDTWIGHRDWTQDANDYLYCPGAGYPVLGGCVPNVANSPGFVGAGECSQQWKLHRPGRDPSDPYVTISNGPLCLAYNFTYKPAINAIPSSFYQDQVIAVDCENVPWGLSVDWVKISDASNPSIVQLHAPKSSIPGPVINGNLQPNLAGGMCLSGVAPNLNISMALATGVFDASGVQLSPVATATLPLGVVATYNLTSGMSYQVITTAATTQDLAQSGAVTTDPIEGALSLLRSAAGSVGTIYQDHQAWWSQKWNVSSVSLGDDLAGLEGWWYGMQYMLLSASRPGEKVPSLWGPWNNADVEGWNDYLTLDYNAQANFFGAGSSNHLELMEPLFDMYTQLIETGKRRARANWTMGGYGSVFGQGSGVSQMSCGSDFGTCPDGFGHYNGIELPAGVGPYPQQLVYKDIGVRFNAALCAVNVIDYFDYSQNMTFLTAFGYPWLRLTADFYVSYVTFNNVTGVYDIPMACAQEGCDARQSHTSTHNEFNDHVDLALSRMVLRKVLAYSSLLGVDADMRPTWTHLLDNLAPYPLGQDSTGQSVFVEASVPSGTVLPVNTNTAYPIVNFAAIHPSGEISLSSSAAVLTTARATIKAVNADNSWRPLNGLCLGWPSATRVFGRDDAEWLLSKMTTALTAIILPNFWPDLGGGGIEQAGATEAINTMLLSSHEEFVRFFPTWPVNRTASFSKLRARGAFVISAQWNGATESLFESVAITSEAGRDFTFLNPCEAVPVVTLKDGTPVVVIDRQNAVFQFSTASGSEYQLHC